MKKLKLSEGEKERIEDGIWTAMIFVIGFICGIVTVLLKCHCL